MCDSLMRTHFPTLRSLWGIREGHGGQINPYINLTHISEYFATPSVYRTVVNLFPTTSQLYTRRQNMAALKSILNLPRTRFGQILVSLTNSFLKNRVASR